MCQMSETPANGKYLPRIVDAELDFKLRSKGAVWIRGTKWCGKSTTAMRHSKTSILMQDEETREQNIALAEADPHLFLSGETPVLIDEWQDIPFIWNQVRTEVDARNAVGQFILTGSRAPNEKVIDEERLHSGVGRITDLTMRPMSLYESGESTGAVSLEKLFAGQEPPGAKCDMGISEYSFLTARGGWPFAVGKPDDVALQQAPDFYTRTVSTEMVKGTKRDPERVDLLMRSYARNCATQASNIVLKKDIAANEDSTLNEDTIVAYVKDLKKLFVVEESKAWRPSVRSKAAARASNTRYFVDPSIACAALRMGPNALIRDMSTFGQFFENMCVRDLRVYSQRLGGTVKHYRDSAGLECDAIIDLSDGRWAAAEIKLGGHAALDEAAENLLKLRDLVGEDNPPAFQMVISGTPGASYRRKDGVIVVPLGLLGP